MKVKANIQFLGKLRFLTYYQHHKINKLWLFWYRIYFHCHFSGHDSVSHWLLFMYACVHTHTYKTNTFFWLRNFVLLKKTGK